MQADAIFSRYKECFELLLDPQVVGRTQHPLLDIFFLTQCAVPGGMDDFEGDEDWGNERPDWRRQFVGPEYGVPSHDTLARVFAAVDSKQF